MRTGLGRATSTIGRAVATPAVALVIFFATVMVTWVVSNPLGGSPDEVDHYLRALSVSGGELVGKDLTTQGSRPPRAAGRIAVRQYWVRASSRVVEVPARLDTGHVRCDRLLEDEDREALLGPRCGLELPDGDTVDRITAMGTVEPLAYALPGAAARLAKGGADRGLRAARLANAGLALVLLAAALREYRRLHPHGVGALLALLAAVTPTVLFVAASPSPSSVEIAAAIAFFLAALAVLDPAGRPTRATWVLLAGAAALLVTSRSLGPVWLLVSFGAALGLCGGQSFRQHRRTWTVVGLVVVLAGASTAVWEAVVQPSFPIDWALARNQVGTAASEVSRALQESVAIFGVLNNVHLPARVEPIWLLAVAALSVWALLVGQQRARLTLAGVVTGVSVAIIALTVLVLNQNAVSLQGRHVLPIVVLLPLCAVQVLVHRGKVGPGVVTAAAVGAIAVHALAVWMNASVYAGRTPLHAGPRRFDFGASSLRWPLLVGVAGLWLVATIIATEFWPRWRHRAERISDQAELVP